MWQKRSLSAILLLVQLHASAQVKFNGDYLFETSAFMTTNFYRFPGRMAVIGKDLLVSGAWGSTNALYDNSAGDLWYLDDQSKADEAIACGVAKRDSAVIERALKAYYWAFKHQKKDGSFDCAENYYQTAIVVEAAAHSCLLLQASPFAMLYRKQVSALIPLITKSAFWLIDEKNLSRPTDGSSSKKLLMATALGEISVLTKDLQLSFVARSYLEDALTQQTDVGVNPEKGGYDCTLQAAGLNYAHRFYDQVEDTLYRARIFSMYEKAVSWLQTRIRSNGVPITDGNTVTGFSAGTGKDAERNATDFPAIAKAIYWWASQKKDEEVAKLAQHVADARYIN